MQNTYQLNLNMKYRKKEFHLWIPKYTLKATNCISIFWKKSDQQTFLNISSEHPKLLKKSIPYSQTLVDEQLEKVDKLVRDDLLQERDQEQQDPKRIPLILTKK